MKARRLDNHLEKHSKTQEPGASRQDLEIINKTYWKKQEEFQQNQYDIETVRQQCQNMLAEMAVME